MNEHLPPPALRVASPLAGRASETPEASVVGDLVNRLAQELAQMQRSLATSHRKLASSMRSLEARTQELGEARTAVTLLRASLECSRDGLMAVPRFGKTTHFNARFAQIWGVSPGHLAELNEAAILALQLALVRDPASFLAGVEARRARPDEVHTVRVALADGRLLEGEVRPERLHGRRIGTVTAWREVEPPRG